jgi:hypothetical protein
MKNRITIINHTDLPTSGVLMLVGQKLHLDEGEPDTIMYLTEYGFKVTIAKNLEDSMLLTVRDLDIADAEVEVGLTSEANVSTMMSSPSPETDDRKL